MCVREHRCRGATQIEWKLLGLIKKKVSALETERSSLPADIPTRSGLEEGVACGNGPITADCVLHAQRGQRASSRLRQHFPIYR